MAAILKLRRGSTTPTSLEQSELFYNSTLATIQVGKSSASNDNITLVKLTETNTGNLQIVGTISGSALTLSGDITAQNLTLGGNATIAGNITFSGSLITFGNEDTDNIVFTGELSSSLIPNNDNTFDIGSTDKKYRNIYANNLYGGVKDSSLLNFTASQETKNSTLATYTGSVDSKLTNLINVTGSYATTGSNNFIGNETITGSLVTSGSKVEFNVQWPTAPTEQHIIKTNGFTLDGREYEYGGFALEHFEDSPGTYHNAFALYMFAPDLSYGSEMLVGPYRSHLQITPSGSTGITLGNISVEDLKNGKSAAKLYADVIEIGLYNGERIKIGNSTASLEIYSPITSSYQISAPLFSGSIYGISDTLNFSQSVDNRLDQLETNSGSVNNSVSLLNSFTSSQENKNTALGTYTGSVNTQLTELYSTASNHETRIDGIQDYTSSLRTAIGISGTNVTINGDLSVLGTTTQINSTQINIGENILELNYGGSATTAGIITKDATGGSTISGSLLWDATNDYWKGGKLGSESKLLLAGGDSVVSGSAQISLVDTADYVSAIKNRLNIESVISSSAQVDVFNTTNFVAYSSSVDSRLTQLSIDSASQDGRLDNLESFTSSQETKNTTLATYTGSNDTKWDILGSVTASLINATSSYETTGRNIVSGSSQLTASYDLRYANSSSFHQLVGEWDYNTQGSIRDAAFYSVTSSAQLDTGSANFTSSLNDSIIFTAGAVKEYVNFRTEAILTAIGAADITSVTAGNGLSGGGVTGDVTLTLDTNSSTFTDGVKNKLNADGVVSGSSQIVSILGPLNAFSASQENKDTTLASYTASVDSHITALNSFTSSINTTIKSKMDSDGVISGSSQLDGKFINNLSGSFTGSFKGNLNGLATYSTYATVTNVSNNADYAVVLTTAGVNGYLGLSTDGIAGMYWNPSVNKLSLTGSVEVVTGGITGSIAATNGVISGSSQIVNILGPLNTYTASQDTKNSTLGTYTGSVDTKFNSLATYTGSVDSSLSQLNAVSHSHSNKTNLDTINQNLATNSDVTFGSFHTTGTGSIGTNLTIYGDLTVFGTQSIINSENLAVSDNMIYLNNNSEVTNPDLGIVGNYNDGAYAHTGIFSDASDSQTWKVFKGYTLEPSGSIDTSHASFALADFKAANITATSFNGVINATNGVLSGSLQAQLPSGVVSGSSQVDLTQTTNYSSGIKTRLNAEGVISGSSQVTLSSTTGGGTSANVQFGSLGIGMAASGTTGRIDATNDIVAYSSSDRRFKDNIKPIENALDKINQIGGYEFDWKEENKIEHGYEGHDLGVIAQEIEAIAPELVQTRENGYKAVKYDKLVSVLIQAVKELSAKVTELENK